MEMLVETDVQVWWLVGTISVYAVSLMTWETRRNGNQISDYIFKKHFVPKAQRYQNLYRPDSNEQDAV